MLNARNVVRLSLVSLPILIGACETEEPTHGDEQNQTETRWSVGPLGKGPDPMDVGGHSRAAVTSSADGTVFVAFQNEDRHLALTTGNANGWTTEVVRDSESGAFASIAFSGDGALHIVHYDATSQTLVDSVRAPGATTWTHDGFTQGSFENEIARGPDGSLHLVLVTRNEATRFDDLTYAKLVDGKWTLEPLGNGSYFNSPAITVDGNGVPHIVAYQWHDESLDTGNLVLADRSSGSWKSEALALPASYATDILVEGTVTHLVYPALDEKGAFYVWRDGNGAWSEPETVLTSDGWDPDLERDSAGALHVALTARGRLDHATRGADGRWARSNVSGSGGHIEPRLVPGQDRAMVATNHFAKGYSFAQIEAK